MVVVAGSLWSSISIDDVPDADIDDADAGADDVPALMCVCAINEDDEVGDDMAATVGEDAMVGSFGLLFIWDMKTRLAESSE